MNHPRIVASMRDNHGMPHVLHPVHTVITHAAPSGPRSLEALSSLDLPNLARLLRKMGLSTTLQGNPDQLTPLHEQVQARQLGLVPVADGLVPWAATDAARLGLTAQHGSEAWAWITPCQWKIHTHHVEMAEPQHLALTPEESDALHRAMQPYFAEDGITLFPHPLGHAHTTWLAQGDIFRDLPTASLDRVAGHTVDAWMPRQAQAKTLRRLQNEMQMLLYTHPVNDARHAQGQPTVNSFWVSGTGNARPPPHTATPPCTVLNTLREPALHDDAAGWARTWQTLDRTALADLLVQLQSGHPVQLTLCGELQAKTLENLPATWWARIRQRFAAPQPHAFLRNL
jgi:hypothetical protein